MQYVFMNHRIRMKKPDGPVIVCLDGKSGGSLESNNFVLRIGGVEIGRVVFDPKGLDACTTHQVTAWVELNDDVDVWFKDFDKVVRKAAVEKKPNQGIKVGK